MTRADLEHFRSLLLDLRQRLSSDVLYLTDEALRGSLDPSQPSVTGPTLFEVETANQRQNFAMHLLHNQEQALEEIDAALTRINEGRFGCCQKCGELISLGRLLILPYALHCIACARKFQ